MVDQLRTQALSIHLTLLDYYGYPKWRNPLPPLDELISTILSQNTNDSNRDRAFDTLRQRFPDWEAVCDAKPEEVIDAIRSAGLANQKGPRIQKVLRQILENHGEFNLDFLKEKSPSEARDWLMQFKGVGPKTAAIVLLFSLGMPAFPVDTHIYRVSGRVGLRPPSMNANQAHAHLAELFPPEAYYPVHLNLIRLGREICQARKPLCAQCPLQHLCKYYADNINQSTSQPE
ncbi:MAG: endonuclease III [Anaerolineales bacterium]|nr:endonuclease III [Anaerolineales bacterium]